MAACIKAESENGSAFYMWRTHSLWFVQAGKMYRCLRNTLIRAKMEMGTSCLTNITVFHVYLSGIIFSCWNVCEICPGS
jgi:hypothetical protein